MAEVPRWRAGRAGAAAVATVMCGLILAPSAAVAEELEGQEWVQHHILQATELLQAGFLVAVIATLGLVYVRTRSLLPVLSTAFAAGVFLWMASNSAWWADRVEDEFAGMGHSSRGDDEGRPDIFDCMGTPPAGYEFGEYWWCLSFRCEIPEGGNIPACQHIPDQVP